MTPSWLKRGRLDAVPERDTRNRLGADPDIRLSAAGLTAISASIKLTGQARIPTQAILIVARNRPNRQDVRATVG